MYSSQACTGYSQIALTLPTKDGYIFQGYYAYSDEGSKFIDANGNWVDDKYNLQGWGSSTDIHLSARWKEEIIHVTLNKDGGIGGTNEFWYKKGKSTTFFFVIMQVQP